MGRGLRDGGLVLDVLGMRQVADPEAREAGIGGSARAADVVAALSGSDLAAVTGNTSVVGMAGLLLGGGYSQLTTRFELAADSLLSAELVSDDGQCNGKRQPVLGAA